MNMITSSVKAYKKVSRGQNKVKVVIFFRGREIIHKDKGLAILARVKEEVADLGTPQTKPMLEGRIMVMMVVPK
jgi:translation initiation factor IF-3